MKINSVKTYITNGMNIFNANYKTAAPSDKFAAYNMQTDTFALSTQKADKTSFGGLFFKTKPKEQSEEDKISDKVNSKVINIMLEHRRVKKRAKDQAEHYKTLLDNGALILGQSYKSCDGGVFKADKKSYDAFTYSADRGPAIDFELQVKKGRPVKFIQRAKVAEGIDEEVYNYKQDSFTYIERIKNKEGKKIRTLKKCEIFYGNGIGKNTYMERNEDGTFSTYIYQGPKKAFTKKLDFFDPLKENIWTKCGPNTRNLASRPTKTT